MYLYFCCYFFSILIESRFDLNLLLPKSNIMHKVYNENVNVSSCYLLILSIERLER